MTVLRANSLAAVTIFVCSTRLKPSSMARLLTTWRALTTSSPLRTGKVSTSRAIAGPAAIDRRAQQLEARVDVQRRANAGQLQPELHQRDGDGRAHADDDRLRIEDARHRGDVAEHPAHERVDHFQRRDVDEHGPGP